ncbi:MAG: hypothetical protein COA38_20455 [Fluviicola sp.]|nr:MAG: hypothetical protein COA38_20455 [Fluviicola sp.]
MSLFAELALAIAQTEASRPGGGQPSDGIDVAVDLIQRTASAEVPDVGGRGIMQGPRQCLEVWGVEIRGAGSPIGQMFSSTSTLDCELPEGWAIERDGAHNRLSDDTGAHRLHWYVHGWDPITVQSRFRYTVFEKHLSPGMSAMQVMDGVKSVHSVIINYPNPRSEAGHGGDRFYLPEGTTQEEYRANDAAREEADKLARAWLTERVPGWDDYARVAESWLLEL